MILPHTKLGQTFTFMKYLASVFSLMFLPKNFNLISCIKAGGKSANEDYLQKYLLIFIFIYDL